MIREKIIMEYVKDKDVLDIGSIGQNKEYSLWSDIKQHAKSLTGIDIISSEEEAVVKGNIEDYNFNRKFDVVIAGDVIEHVDNQGLLLDNIKKHLKEDGVVIITTPNARWLSVLKRSNPTHMLWHDRFTLKAIVEKHSFKIVRFFYYYGNKLHYPLLTRPLIARQSMAAVCKHSDL
ncbi:MAG: class I SAM-dependent methyltransferase [Candidatus Omnitrophota bacterium]